MILEVFCLAFYKDNRGRGREEIITPLTFCPLSSVHSPLPGSAVGWMAGAQFWALGGSFPRVKVAKV